MGSVSVLLLNLLLLLWRDRKLGVFKPNHSPRPSSWEVLCTLTKLHYLNFPSYCSQHIQTGEPMSEKQTHVVLGIWPSKCAVILLDRTILKQGNTVRGDQRGKQREGIKVKSLREEVTEDDEWKSKGKRLTISKNEEKKKAVKIFTLFIHKEAFLHICVQPVNKSNVAWTHI